MIMRSRLPVSLMTAATLFLTRSTVARPADPTAGAAEGAQINEATVKKYEFNPSPIRVKPGTRVQLKITATDHAHNFAMRQSNETIAGWRRC
jgi:plastocyanin